jgi:hypothetical protein
MMGPKRVEILGAMSGEERGKTLGRFHATAKDFVVPP